MFSKVLRGVLYPVVHVNGYLKKKEKKKKNKKVNLLM